MEVNYNGEYLLFIHYLTLLCPSRIPTEVGMASHIWRLIFEDSLFLFFWLTVYSDKPF